MPHLCTAQPTVTLPLTRCSAGLSRQGELEQSSSTAAQQRGQAATAPGRASSRWTLLGRTHHHASAPPNLTHAPVSTRALALPDRSAVGLPLDLQLLSPSAALSLVIVRFILLFIQTNRQTDR